MEFIQDWIETFKEVRARRKRRDENIKESIYGKTCSESMKVYRSMWPKTPYTCCDNAHEAGFAHGFLEGKKFL